MVFVNTRQTRNVVRLLIDVKVDEALRHVAACRLLLGVLIVHQSKVWCQADDLVSGISRLQGCCWCART